MEITEIECSSDVCSSDLKREDVLMQLVAMQRLVEKAEYSPDLAFEYFGYSEQKRQLYKKVVDYMIDVSK